MSRTGFSRPAAHRGRSEVGNEEVTVIELRGNFSLTAFQAQIASIDRCGVVGSVVTIVLIFNNFRAGFRCAEKRKLERRDDEPKSSWTQRKQRRNTRTGNDVRKSNEPLASTLQPT